MQNFSPITIKKSGTRNRMKNWKQIQIGGNIFRQHAILNRKMKFEQAEHGFEQITPGSKQSSTHGLIHFKRVDAILYLDAGTWCTQI